MKQKLIGLSALLLLVTGSFAQTWADTLDQYAREKYLPAHQYQWLWTHAALLSTFVQQYDAASEERKPIYLQYIKKAMDKNVTVANGRTPNDVASGLGLAFLYRVTKEEKYKAKAEKIYCDYLKTRRTADGAVSHLLLFTELWDDTIFMIGEFLLNMYRATGDEKYLDEFMKQFRLHREKLQNKATGLWYHGWDSDQKTHCTFCSEMHWADKTTRQSTECWGRGNGWIMVTLSDALDIVPQQHAYRKELGSYLLEMVEHLPEWQDEKTGHWYQLPVHHTDPDNWIESSATAMFAYGIHTALREGLVSDARFKQSVARAYSGLRLYSVIPEGERYLTPRNVCTGTCIGHKSYYYKRASKKGSPYGIGMFIRFGKRYETEQGIGKL
ncbi:MAG: glycoside hydrolase family 88 protein [Bacteroidetes bacterium]|nr:glycoside hydrolase family 88 protein [Bacteroidota bacterium]